MLGKICLLEYHAAQCVCTLRMGHMCVGVPFTHVCWVLPLQKGSLAEEYSGIILLLRRRLLVADSGKQHFTAVDVNSDKVCRQCCAVDLLYTVAAISCAKSAVGTCHGT